MKVLVFSNKNKDIDFLKTREIINYLLFKNVDVVVDEQMYESFSKDNVSCFHELIADTIDFLIVLGGDGTFLTAAHNFYKYKIPYLGLNIGRVGYLTQCDMTNYYLILDNVLENRYEIKEKTLLKVQIIKNDDIKKIIGFNEVVIHRGHALKMLKIDVKVANEFMDTFYADGVMVSTSMGSSAYNLSAGGPLLLENAKCFAITSICSQSGIMPPVVCSDDDMVEIKAISKDGLPFLITVDGKGQIEVNNGTSIIVSKSSTVLPVIYVKQENKKLNHILKAFDGYIK